MQTQNDRQLLGRCMAYLRPYSGLQIGIYGTMLLINLINVAAPQFIRWGIDVGIYGGDLALLGWAAVLLLVLTLVKDGDHRLSRPEDIDRLIAAVSEFD